MRTLRPSEWGRMMHRVLDYTATPARPGSSPGAVADCLTCECRRLEHLLAGYQAYLGHDLANQLVAIQGFARHLETEAIDFHPDAALLLNRLADLTRRADQYSRRLAEIGRAVREPTPDAPVPLLEVVYEAVASVKSSPRPGAVLTRPTRFEVREPMPVARVPGRLLFQVIAELLHNAVAALPGDRVGTVVVQAHNRSDGTTLVVSDDGRGFPEAQLARLGEPGHVSPLTHAQALGYFLILQAVARWRGRLAVRSEAGVGTTVSLTLPAASPPAASREEGGGTP